MECRKCSAPTERKDKQCKACYNAYMSEYMTARYHRRRAEFVKSRGSICEKCYSVGPDFEIDHVDPAAKSFAIGPAMAGWSDKKLAPELAKCQLLCVPCHKEKTRVDLAKRFGQRTHWEHGTLAGYRHCRCPECKAAKSAYSKAHKKKSKGL